MAACTAPSSQQLACRRARRLTWLSSRRMSKVSRLKLRGSSPKKRILAARHRGPSPGDLADFIRMVQKSLKEEPEMSVVSATTALHRLARGWSAGNGGTELASATVDVLVLLSHRLADIFRYANSPSSSSGFGGV